MRRLPVLWTTTVQRNVLIVGTFVRRKILRGWRCERQRNNAGFAHVAGCRQNSENLRRIRTLPHFSHRLQRPSPRTQVCVVRSCVPRVHVSGRPILYADVDMVIEAKVSSGSDSIGDAEGKNINMMWCSRCGGEGVVYSLSKKQKRERRLEREAAAGASVECPRDLSSSEMLARAPPAKVAPANHVWALASSPRPAENHLSHTSSPLELQLLVQVSGVRLWLWALQQRGVHVSLFERDTSFLMRKQGYGLTLQKYSGAAALKQLGVLLDGVGSNANISPKTAESWVDMDTARDFMMTRKWPSTQLHTPAERMFTYAASTTSWAA